MTAIKITFLAFLLFMTTLISCHKRQEMSKEKEAYKIINVALEHYYKEKGTTLETESRLNPFFTGFYPDKNNIDSSLIVISSLDNYQNDNPDCKCSTIPSFEVGSHKEYYKNQLSSINTSIDFDKITNDIYSSYKSEIENKENIEGFNFYKNDSLKFSNKFIAGQRRYYLSKENGYFELSYPLISYNKREAVILVSTLQIGYQLWIFEKTNEEWIRKCSISRGSIN